MDNVGVIMKIKRSKAIVMTKKLDFLEIPRQPDMIPGQKICFDSSLILQKNKNNIYRYMYAAASFAAIFLLAFFSFQIYSSIYPPKAIEYAYVDIDINPSFELVLDNQNKIITTLPLNSDGKILLSDLSLAKKDVSSALAIILDKSEQSGYLNQAEKTNTVLISVSLNPNHNDNKTSDAAQKRLAELADSLDTIVRNAKKNIHPYEVIKATETLRQQALDSGISMGKYALYLKARDQGIPFSLNDIKNINVPQILDRINDGLKGNTNHVPNSTTPSYTPHTPTPLENTYIPTIPQPTSYNATPELIVATGKVQSTPFVALTATSSSVQLTSTPKPTEIPVSYHTYTPIRTYSEKPDFTPVATPTSTSTPDFTPASTSYDVKLKMYNVIRTPKSKELHLRFKLLNNGSTPINLALVKIRYFYSFENVRPVLFSCDWTEIGKDNVTGTIQPMANPTSIADHYLELGFSSQAGALQPGKTIEIVTRVSNDYKSKRIDMAKDDFIQTNDYSFNATDTSLKYWDMVTVYVSDKLIWGIEP